MTKTNQQEGEGVRKITPSEIISQYTLIIAGTLEQTFGGYYTKTVTLQDWFETSQEADEWESKINQFILENRNDI